METFQQFVEIVIILDYHKLEICLIGENKMSLGENIKRRRIELNLSQQYLADSLGYKTRSSISKLEKNGAAISEQKLGALANILKTSVEYLLTGENPYETDKGRTHIISPDIEDYAGSTERKCCAVILAGGQKHLNKYNIPFQFITVKEKPVIIYTMEALQRHPQIDDIHVVCLEGWEDQVSSYAEKYGITKLKEIIKNGKTGVDSVKNAVEWLSTSYKPSDLILIHEATRPFVDPETVSNAIRCCKKNGSAVVFERLDWSTPFMMHSGDFDMSHLDSRKLISVQSPEIFTFGLLRKAFSDAIASEKELSETVCTVFLHNMGFELTFCEGRKNNFSVVNNDDLTMMAALL